MCARVCSRAPTRVRARGARAWVRDRAARAGERIVACARVRARHLEEEGAELVVEDHVESEELEAAGASVLGALSARVIGVLQVRLHGDDRLDAAARTRARRTRGNRKSKAATHAPCPQLVRGTFIRIRDSNVARVSVDQIEIAEHAFARATDELREENEQPRMCGNYKNHRAVQATQRRRKGQRTETVVLARCAQVSKQLGRFPRQVQQMKRAWQVSGKHANERRPMPLGRGLELALINP
eukprot:6199655-Pleurochrysis_carterae.AAC.1